MKLAPFPDYRSCNLDWAETIPTHWREGKLRWLSTRFAGGTPDRANEAYWNDGTIPWLASGTVNQFDITEPSEYISEEGFKNSSARWIPRGGLVIALAGQGKTKGMVAQLQIEATCNQSMAAIIPQESLTNRFLLYWLGSNYQNIRNLAGGDLRDGLNLDLLGSISCPIPPIDEQRKISKFLDRETAKIDALVAEQEKLIELLKEKRQAAISHAVTKGLVPEAPMKDSGIEWLGSVPKHWCLTAVGHVCEFISYGFTNPMPVTDDGPFMLTANDIGYGEISYSSARRTSAKAFVALTEKSRPLKNDILLTKDGTLGRVALHDGSEACINQSVAVLRPSSRIIFPRFLELALLGSVYQEKMLFDAGGTTIKHIYITRLSKMHLMLPSFEEQQAIVSYVEDVLAKIDGLLSASSKAIDLLKERRSALISAAVTGKIDVRSLVGSEAA